MSRRTVVLLGSVLVLLGLVMFFRQQQQPQQQTPDGDLDALFSEWRTQCGLSEEQLRWAIRPGRQVLILPSKEASFDGVDCFFKKLFAADLGLNLGFVGNERAR